MISIEAAREGFALSWEGRRILGHSRRSPCVELGEGPAGAAGGRSSGRPRFRARFRPLRDFRVLEASAEAALVEFGGRLRMQIGLVGGRLRIALSAESPSLPLRLRLSAFPEERIYGAGAASSSLDLKGRRLSLWAGEEGPSEEAEGGRGAGRRGGGRGSPGAFPLPVYLSSRNYWCAVETEFPVELDFRRPASTRILAWGMPREIVLGRAESAPRLLGDLSEALGRQSAPPGWAFDGLWLELGGRAEELEARLEGFLRAGVRIALLSTPGGGLGEAPEPGGKELVARARARGLRCLGRVSPLLRPGTRCYVEAASSGYLLRDAEGRILLLGPEGEGEALVDLSDSAAFGWLKSLLRSDLVEAGYAGWKAELPRGLPPDARLGSGEDARLARNAWPLLWARANREAIEEAGLGEELLFVMRSGWLGASRFLPVVGLGEGRREGPGPAGLAGLVRSSLSLGMSGLGFGLVEARRPAGRRFRGRERERLFRRLELGAFSPLLGLREEGLEEDPQALAFLARISEIYASLKPYHAAVAEEYRESGLPPIRHPYLHYEAEAELHLWPTQYLYGRDLIAAPVLRPARESAELLLPSDEWIHLWSSRRFRGGRVAVEAPLGFPAVFYRAASAFAPLFDALRRTSPRI